MPNTLRESWGHTLGLTYGTFRFHFTSRRGRFVSRVLTLIILIAIAQPMAWAIVTPVWFAWRTFRMYERLCARKAERRAHKGSQVALKRERRKFRMLVEIG